MILDPAEAVEKMGGAASTSAQFDPPAHLDEDQVRGQVGDDFDAQKFEEAKDEEGKVTWEAFAAAVEQQHERQL